VWIWCSSRYSLVGEDARQIREPSFPLRKNDWCRIATAALADTVPFVLRYQALSVSSFGAHINQVYFGTLSLTISQCIGSTRTPARVVDTLAWHLHSSCTSFGWAFTPVYRIVATVSLRRIGKLTKKPRSPTLISCFGRRPVIDSFE
jgi:hypothetical protein